MSARPSYAEASKVLLRTTLLDGMHDLLMERDWSAVTMSDVAAIAGVSRQTVYNEFKSRNGLAQAYSLRLADRFVSLVAAAIERNVDDANGALRDGFQDFFTSSADDPLIRSLLSGAAKPDLLKLITTDAAPLITTASIGLAEALRTSWLDVPADDAARLGRAIARMALSYIAMPPEDDRDVAADLAAVMAPPIEVARRR
ncbi:TetR/AcrR family transcriptional regulator [Gordonia soli]|nr:TetR family transcriptional regulator [Gordonia soli]